MSPYPSPLERRRSNWPGPFPASPQYSTKVPSSWKIANRPLTGSGTQIRPPGPKVMPVIGLKPSPGPLDFDTNAATGGHGVAGGSVGALGERVGRGAVAIGAGTTAEPSPEMRYTFPVSVARNTDPLATATQQWFAPSTSRCQSSPPVAASRA